MSEYLLRFLVGGFAVSAFAVLGDIFRPKSFSGLFGAAPSIALSTLVIALHKEGADYAAAEGRSMILGAVALWLYSITVCRLMKRNELPALAASSAAFVVWMSVALGLKWILLKA